MIEPMALTRSAGRLAGDTPTQLRVATAITVLCAVAVSIGGWYALDRRANAIDDAGAAAAQLVRVQEVRVLVVQADSLASTAYLRGGQELAEQRRLYDDSIAAASGGLIDSAASAAGTDAATLQRATSLLARYVGLAEQARANNRQGFPVGAAYQRQARTVIEEVVVALREVETNSRARVNDTVASGHRSSWLLLFTALVLVAAIVGGSVWLAQRFRRLVNVPLAIAGALTIVVLGLVVARSAAAMTDADDAVIGPLAAADLLAQGRAAGFDARSNEALTLIARGNGDAYEIEWQRSASAVEQSVDRACSRFSVGCDARNWFGSYRSAHDVVRTLDADGNWDAAVDASLGDAVGLPNARVEFEAFAAASDEALQLESDRAAVGFATAGDSLGNLGWLTVVVGLIVAVLASAGYGQRVREYR